MSEYRKRPPIESLPLFGEAHARATDPDTSHAAAASIDPDRLRASQRAVLECLNEHGPLTDYMLFARYVTYRAVNGWPQQSPSGFRTRRRELVDAGLVVSDGKLPLPSGRMSYVWRAT